MHNKLLTDAARPPPSLALGCMSGLQKLCSRRMVLLPSSLQGGTPIDHRGNDYPPAKDTPSLPTSTDRKQPNNEHGTGHEGLPEANLWDVRSWKARAKQMQEQLRSLGLAGVVAYGLLNTAYYTLTFLFVWLYVAQIPHGQGPAVAARRFVEVFGMVWAGSQVTKLARAAGALVMAPVVDHGLELVRQMLKLDSKQQAFTVVLLICVAVSLVVFGTVILAWA